MERTGRRRQGDPHRRRLNLVPANAYWWNKDRTEQHVDCGRIMIVSKPVEDVLIDVPSDEDIEAGRVAAPPVAPTRTPCPRLKTTASTASTSAPATR